MWSGTEAVRIGLADRIGGCYQALETLCSIINVSRDEALIVSYPKEKYFFKNPFDLPSIYRILADLIADGKDKTMISGLMENDYIFYRLPYNLEIE